MHSTVREIKEEEYALLENFLYEAIFVPEGRPAPPRSVLSLPELRLYVDGFGSRKDDTGLVAEADGAVVGAIWARIMDDYGHIDGETPSLAVSLYREYRGRGIGTALLCEMLSLLKRKGYERVSLSVQKANYALKMYEKAGFEVVDETEEEYREFLNDIISKMSL